MASLPDLIRLPVAVPQRRDPASIADAVEWLPDLIEGMDRRLSATASDVALLRESANMIHVHVATLGTDLSALGS